MDIVPLERNGAHPELVDAIDAYDMLVADAEPGARREGLMDTPARAARAWRELTCGYDEPAPSLQTFDADHDEVVVVAPIPLYSLCEHHLLPFHGHAHIGYLPSRRVLGLSKFARVVNHFSRRLQVQERLTTEIADYLETGLAKNGHSPPRGMAVVIRAEHLCMSMRGTQVAGAITTTSVMRGVFRDRADARAEVLALMGVTGLIKYHGGVLATRAIPHWEYAGKHFCVSWAYPDKVELYHQIGQSVMLDNGAFSKWSQGDKVNWQEFYEWAEPWLRYQTTWAIVPDVLDAGGQPDETGREKAARLAKLEHENDALLHQWPFDPEKGSPVWHIQESLDRLETLVYQWSLVCLGISSDAYGRINSPTWRKRMEDVMDVACDAQGYPRTRLHLLRGLKFCGGPYPLYSADSATVARGWSGAPGANKKVAPRLPAQYYASFDGLNPPPRWERDQQLGLFGTEPEEMDAGDLDEGPALADEHPDNANPAIPLQRTGLGKAQDTLI